MTVVTTSELLQIPCLQMMGTTLQKVIHKYFHEKQFIKNIVNKRLQRSGKHYQGNWVCHGVVRASCFLWDKGDKEAPQGGRAEHLSQGQSPSTRSRAGQGAAGATPDLGIRYLHWDGDGMRPVWDIGLWVGVRIQITEED